MLVKNLSDGGREMFVNPRHIMFMSRMEKGDNWRWVDSQNWAHEISAEDAEKLQAEIRRMNFYSTPAGQRTGKYHTG